jgi:predicted deacylase
MDKFDIKYLSNKTGGDISLNRILNQYVPKTELSKFILEKALKGTVIYKFGDDVYSKNRIAILSGVHGNELAPQIASLHIMEKLNSLDSSKINGVIYIIPFVSPYSSMRNSRYFDGRDLNRMASIGGNISNDLVKYFKNIKVDAVGDFHSTAPNANPGVEAVFSTKKPSKLSYEIASHISEKLGSKLIAYENAGNVFNGALEDELNLNGIPAVTCEVLSQNGHLNNKSFKQSLLQMNSYLDYFNMIL